MNRLKKLRNEYGLTLKGLAKDLVDRGFFTSMTDATLTRYENESREPKGDAWQKIAEYFDVSPAYLRGESNYITGDVDNEVLHQIFTFSAYVGMNENEKALNELEKILPLLSDMSVRGFLNFSEVFARTIDTVDTSTFSISELRRFKRVLDTSANESKKLRTVLRDPTSGDYMQSVVDTESDFESTFNLDGLKQIMPKNWNEAFRKKVMELELHVSELDRLQDVDKEAAFFYTSGVESDIEDLERYATYTDKDTVLDSVIDLEEFILNQNLSENSKYVITELIHQLKNPRTDLIVSNKKDPTN